MAIQPKLMPGQGSKNTDPLEYWHVPMEYQRHESGLGKVTATIVRYGDIALDSWGCTVVKHGAFSGGLAHGHRVTVSRMHQVDQVVAWAGAGLTLIDDPDALRCEIELRDTHFGRMVAEELDAGLYPGLCPEFSIFGHEDRPLKDEGAVLRMVTRAQLWSIAFVNTPGFTCNIIDSWERYDWSVKQYPAYFDRRHIYRLLEAKPEALPLALRRN